MFRRGLASPHQGQEERRGFTRWKDHDSYQKAFERDLKAEAKHCPLTPHH
jgi:hypothetical protein